MVLFFWIPYNLIGDSNPSEGQIMMPIDQQPAQVFFISMSEYEVTFYILKPKRVRTSQIVKANSMSDAKAIIVAQYGKDGVNIISTKKVEKR